MNGKRETENWEDYQVMIKFFQGITEQQSNGETSHNRAKFAIQT